MTRTRVRFGDTDAAGIVFYPTFYAWFDVGTTGLLRAASGSMLGAEGRPRWPVPIVEAGATFIAPLYYDDAIAIRTTVVELGASSLRLEHVVTRGETDVARGFEVRVHCAYVDGRIRACAIPDDLRRELLQEISSDDEVA